MPKVLSPTLVNATAAGIGCGDYALDNLKIGDQVKLLVPITANASRPENRISLWVRVTEINKNPNPERELLTGVVEEVLDLGETPIEEGQTIRFARCNIAEVA